MIVMMGARARVARSTVKDVQTLALQLPSARRPAARMLSLRSPLRLRNGPAQHAVPGACEEDKENAFACRHASAALTTRGCAPNDEAPHGGNGGGSSNAALVRALAAARAEAAELRDRLATAAQRGVTVSRERHALSARVAELTGERDALKAELDRVLTEMRASFKQRADSEATRPSRASVSAAAAAQAPAPVLQQAAAAPRAAAAAAAASSSCASTR